MKQVTIAVGLVAVGLAAGLVMPGILAQTPQAEVQRWEQFCEESGSKKGALERANARLIVATNALSGSRPTRHNIWYRETRLSA